jgi:hypothetical protein
MQTQVPLDLKTQCLPLYQVILKPNNYLGAIFSHVKRTGLSQWFSISLLSVCLITFIKGPESHQDWYKKLILLRKAVIYL